MAKKKRHRDAEIAAKLAEADALVEQGRTQIEIAHALGISVMTYHRWRKAQPHRPAAVPSPVLLTNLRATPNQLSRMADLQTENARLRKLVTDLLLEKMRLEEELNGQPSAPKRARR